MIYNWDKKLKIKLYILEADIITIKKKRYWFDVSNSKDEFSLQEVFQMTTIVSVINHYDIYGLHLFWDTLYNNIINLRQVLHRPRRKKKFSGWSIRYRKKRLRKSLRNRMQDLSTGVVEYANCISAEG